MTREAYRASTGFAAVLDVPIGSIHQRVPFAIGSRVEMARLEKCMGERS